GELRVIPVASQEVTKLAPLVTQLLAEQTAARPDTVPAPQVTADAAGRRLIVLAVADDMARIEAIVKELDGGAAASTQRQTRVFRLESASAAELAPTLEQVVINDANRDRVQVLVDARSNSLVVTGPAETIEAAQQLIAQLDAGPNREPRELRVVDLKAADAATLAPMVTELFTSMMRDAHGP